MKAALLLSLSAAVAGSRLPEFEWDPATIKSCVEWYNNDLTSTCEYVRDYFTITPEQFHAWNPSIGLDCKPWRFQSYCIVTQERLDHFSKTRIISSSTTTTTTTSTSTSSTLGPSPTVWGALGCYAENTGTNFTVLEKRMSSQAGDAALTIPKCQDFCYRAGFRFAGVEYGNQCWCSSYVAGEWAKHSAECNLPCSGDLKTICGGQDRFNIFQADEPDDPIIVITTASSDSTSTQIPSTISSKSTGAQTQSGIPIATQSMSGAARKVILF